jgi:hypothetical protein
MSFKKFVGAFSLFITFTSVSNAQLLTTFSNNMLMKIKDGRTHIIVAKKDFPRSSEYYNVFKKYWTITKGVDVLLASDVAQNLVVGDTYFDLQSRSAHSQHGYTIDLCLNLFTPSEHTVKNKNKKRWYSSSDEIADIYISMDRAANGQAASASVSQDDLPMNFDGG